MSQFLSQLFHEQVSEWQPLLDQLTQPYFKQLSTQLEKAYLNQRIYPAKENIFNAYALTPLAQVKVVIIGQDPYHGRGQAHGLSFSVLPPTPTPPSLKNIYKELSADIHLPVPTSGNLTPWAEQGVLLLNTVLTVQEAKANAHKNWGWEIFTSTTLQVISSCNKGVVFVLWGGQAQKLKKHIDSSKHVIIESAHPSPLSAYRGFLGSRPFSKINATLQAANHLPIHWNID